MVSKIIMESVMRFNPIKELLAYIEECHLALADLYLRLSLDVNDDKVKKLLNFMCNREQLSFFNLHEYAEHAPKSLLNTSLESIYDQSLPTKCLTMKTQPNLSIQDALALAMMFDMQLIELAQTTAYNSPTIEAELALENISDQEEEAFHQVVSASHEFDYV